MRKSWRDRSVDGGGDAPGRESLDVWQRFLFDIFDKKAEQWYAAARRYEEQAYVPARVIGAGTAGTGKSRTIRAIVAARQARARLAGERGERVSQCCTLAAPTGTAAYQMKHGATTAHGTFGIYRGGSQR